MIHPQALLDRISRFVDRTAGADGCHPWLGRAIRGTPYLPIGNRNIAPRRILFEEFHLIRLPTQHRVISFCGSSICCNVRHLSGGDLRMRMQCIVDSSGGPLACWPYRGEKFKGYGRIGVSRGRRRFAHRVAYELAFGPIEGHIPGDHENEKLVMHTCDNPPCCNPRHLRLGTDIDNIHDCIAKGRNSRGPKHASIMRAARAREKASRECAGRHQAPPNDAERDDAREGHQGTRPRSPPRSEAHRAGLVCGQFE